MESFIKKIYFYKFLDSFTLIYPIFTLLFQRAGLNTLQIASLIIIWSVTQLVLELPTGVIADKFSRRNVLIIANICRATCFVLWLIGGYWIFAIGFIFWGIKNALAGGTYQALLFDELKNFGREDLYEKVSGKAEGWRFLGVAVSAILGGFVALYSFPVTLILSAITTFSAGIFLLSIKPVKKVQELEQENYWEVFKKAALYTKTNIALLFTVIVICVIFGAYGAADEFWALIYNHFGLSVNIIGILIAAGYGLSSFAGHTIHFFEGKKFKNLEYPLIIIGGIALIVAGLGRNIWLIGLILLSFYVLQIAGIKVEAKLQHQIRTTQRATIFSIKSLINEFSTMFFDFVFGFVGASFGILSILVVFGGIITFGTLFFIKLERILQKRAMLIQA